MKDCDTRERREREIARSVDGSRLNDRDHEARGKRLYQSQALSDSDNSLSFAMGDGEAKRIKAGNRGYWPIMNDLLLLVCSRVLHSILHRYEQRRNLSRAFTSVN